MSLDPLASIYKQGWEIKLPIILFKEVINHSFQGGFPTICMWMIAISNQ